MQQILVTGGAGKLGRLVVKQLSAAGYSVRGMSRRASPGEDWPGAEWKQADLVTGEGLAEAVQGMDVVVHLAGKGNWKVDFEGTRRLLEAAQEAGVWSSFRLWALRRSRMPSVKPNLPAKTSFSTAASPGQFSGRRSFIT